MGLNEFSNPNIKCGSGNMSLPQVDVTTTGRECIRDLFASTLIFVRSYPLVWRLQYPGIWGPTQVSRGWRT